MAPMKNVTSPGTRKRYCGLGNHHLRSPHKTIQDKNILKFAQHINPELRGTTLLCGVCYDKLVEVYNAKLKRAIQKRKSNKNASNLNSSISDVSYSESQLSQSSSSVSVFSVTSASSTNKTKSSTSKRKRDDDDDNDDDSSSLSLNAVNGSRLPNVQPIPRRRQFVHVNQNVMDIYLAGTTGG